MRPERTLALLLVFLMLAPVASAVSGRAAPNCSTMEIGDISSQIAVDAGTCLIIDIGTRSSSQVLEFDLDIVDDAVDVLFFDTNGLQPYELGQSYRSSFVSEASFESALGSYDYDWRPPSSLTDKNWYLVIDNAAHDGDQGMGDQGGMRARFTIDITIAQDGQWTPLHDLFLFQVEQQQTLLDGGDLTLDEGTGITIRTDVISGSGDLYLQSDNQVGGDLFLSGTKMDDITGTSSLSWSVPSFLDVQALNLVVDTRGQSSPLHFTIEVELDPPLNPIISDDDNATTSIDETITLNALSTPNRLGQVSSLSWDFDGDGIEDDSGMIVDASWDSPGTKTVNLTASSPTGASMTTSHIVEVEDLEIPVAVITGNGIRGLNGEWRLLRTADLQLSAVSSFDDDMISSNSWSIDGEPFSSATQITVSWSEIGSHLIKLTVTDGSGNIGFVNTTVIVYDSTIPILETSALDELNEVHKGDTITLKGTAVDMWDDSADLRYEWDLNPGIDDDDDGDARNDADMVGQTIEISFDEIGTKSIALTVYDASNNSDLHVFTIEVVEPPSTMGAFAIVVIVILVALVTLGVVLFGHRRLQHGAAIQLLMQSGLTHYDAQVRVIEIAKTRKIPPFAKAAQLAGLEEGMTLRSDAQKAADAKAAEMNSIYGEGGGTIATDPNAGFRPTQPQVRRVDHSLSMAALEAFADDLPSEAVKQKSSVVSGKVRSGGVVLPQVTPKVEIPEAPAVQSHSLKSDCTACGKGFAIELPEGVNQAVVACPSCGIDQLFQR